MVHGKSASIRGTREVLFPFFLNSRSMSRYARVNKLELCYDPARDRRAIAQVEGAHDIWEREADYLSSPRIDGRDEGGSRAETMGRKCRMRINSSLGLEFYC